MEPRLENVVSVLTVRDCVEEGGEAVEREAMVRRGQGGENVVGSDEEEIDEETELVDAWPPRTVHDGTAVAAEVELDDARAAAAAAAAAARSREPPGGIEKSKRRRAKQQVSALLE